jgi:Icc-related predicted phosphoesterase
MEIMKILALSDIHGFLPKIDRHILSMADCVMIAGDVCPIENHYQWFQELWLENDFSKWAAGLRKPVYLTMGNHDFVENFKAPPNLRHGTARIVDDVLLFSWTPAYGGWAWEADEVILAIMLENILAKKVPSIWLTHAPPWGICDYIEAYRGLGQTRLEPGNEDWPIAKYHKGSLVLRKAIEAYRPRLVICGHIHKATGYEGLKGTGVFNVSLMDTNGFCRKEPTLIEIDRDNQIHFLKSGRWHKAEF